GDLRRVSHPLLLRKSRMIHAVPSSGRRINFMHRYLARVFPEPVLDSSRLITFPPCFPFGVMRDNCVVDVVGQLLSSAPLGGAVRRKPACKQACKAGGSKIAQLSFVGLPPICTGVGREG